MTGTISEEARNKVNSYLDFTTCERPDGSRYGTGGTCRKGTPVSRKFLDSLSIDDSNRRLGDALANAKKGDLSALERELEIYEAKRKSILDLALGNPFSNAGKAALNLLAKNLRVRGRVPMQDSFQRAQMSAAKRMAVKQKEAQDILNSLSSKGG